MFQTTNQIYIYIYSYIQYIYTLTMDDIFASSHSWDVKKISKATLGTSGSLSDSIQQRSLKPELRECTVKTIGKPWENHRKMVV